jgi:hypothetical protein
MAGKIELQKGNKQPRVLPKRQGSETGARDSAIEPGELELQSRLEAGEPESGQAFMPLGTAAAIALQGTVGNRAAQRLMRKPQALNEGADTAQAASMDQVFRYVEYNEEVEGGRFTDPEQASGTLPFNETGWDGDEILRSFSQLNTAVAHNDNVRCVEAAFLASMMLRGPGAVREMIENYLARYRLGLSQASTPEDIKRWYRRSIVNMEPLPGKIDDKTLEYEDLSTLMTEMYSVYGQGSGGTFEGPESNMMRREGYTVTGIHKAHATQAETAAEAQALAPGESLACAVDVHRAGTGELNHRITIGRKPGEGGTLYLYDPWPVIGDQMVDTDENLDAIAFYFTNVDSTTEDTGEETETGEPETMTIETTTARNFEIDLKYSPPAEATEGA